MVRSPLEVYIRGSERPWISGSYLVNRGSPWRLRHHIAQEGFLVPHPAQPCPGS